MTTASTAWVMSNWWRIAGLPTPDADPWMLRDTPLTRSTLECLKSNSLIELVERNCARPATRTARATQQATYRTKRHGSVFDKIGEYTDLSVEAAEAFAARPSADVYIVELFAWLGTTVADEVRRIEDEFDLDVQLVGVGIEEPGEYLGEFIEVDTETLSDASSPVLRAVPDVPDVLVMHSRIRYGDVSSTVFGRTDPSEHLVNPDDRMLDQVIRNLLVDGGDVNEGPRSPSRERSDDRHRKLSHFDESEVADDEVTFNANGKDGDRQATLEELF